MDEEVVVLPPGPCPCASAVLCRCACASATPCTHRIAARINAGTFKHARTRPGGALELALAPLATMGQRGLGGRDREAKEKVAGTAADGVGEGPVEVGGMEEEASWKELPGRLRPY